MSNLSLKRVNDLRTLIISSPNSEFITHLYEILKQPWNYSGQIKIGHMKFRIDSLDKLVVNLPDNSPISLITGTPIIVRIPREKYKSYGIEPSGKYDYIYWRKILTNNICTLLNVDNKTCTICNSMKTE